LEIQKTLAESRNDLSEELNEESYVEVEMEQSDKSGLSETLLGDKSKKETTIVQPKKLRPLIDIDQLGFSQQELKA
jgi:hypothetical protein